MLKNSVIFGLISVFLLSCATYQLVPVQSEAISLQNNRGKILPVYKDNEYSITISPELKEYEIMIKVTFTNNSSKVISVADSEFSVLSSRDGIKWTSVPVFSSKDYYSKAKNSYIAGGVFLAFSDDDEGTRYGSSARQIKRYRDETELREYKFKGEAWLFFLENSLFYSSDVEPGKTYYGILFSKKGSGTYYKIKYNNPNLKVVEMQYEKVKNK